MKFRLFGGLDCPDYLLAQLSVVADVDVSIIEPMALHVRSCLLQEGHATTEEMTQEFLSSQDFAGIDRLDIGQALVAIHTLLTCVIRFRVPADAAVNEITLLGISPAVAQCIVNTISPQQQAMARDAMIEADPSFRSSLRARSPTPENASVTVWHSEKTGETSLNVDFKMIPRHGGPELPVPVAMSAAKLRALLAELVTAREALRTAARTIE